MNLEELQTDIAVVGDWTVDDIGGPLAAETLSNVLEAARLVANPKMERWLCFSSMGESLELFHHKDDNFGDPWNDGHTDLCGRYLLIVTPQGDTNG